MTGPSRIEAGRIAFNRGEYFLAHDLWEEVWRELVDAERTFVQGLIQIAAGLHHLQQGRRKPAAGLLRKGLDKLVPPTNANLQWATGERISAAFGDLRLPALVHQLAQLLANLETPGATLPDLAGLTL